ncbi:MAG: 2OG-Fe(II) oxygenase [Alphaproteobacteria bacterium]|nr:2OG-Fe(II) oxygenase [Alphaproteobacteria bacterium]
MVGAATVSLPLPPFLVGDPIPWFSLPTGANPDFKLQTVAGRFVVLCFFGSAADSHARARLDAALSHAPMFDDERVAFFGISTDRADRDQGRVKDAAVGVRFFWDLDGAVSKEFRPSDGAGVTYVLDPTLRVVAALRLDDPRGHDQRLKSVLAGLPHPDRHAGVELNAPVLIVPRVFELGLCRKLIEIYETGGGEDSGFMREADGKTVSVIDHNFKKRRDCSIEDTDLRAVLMRRIHARLVPEIKKAFQFAVTRMERYLVACYEADSGGYFRPHRDNTTKGTTHRRFAVTINLNAEAYAGGDLRFPEYGSRTYRAPTGGAVVFSCSLLHEATPVTRGRRFAFLPFLYDDAAARHREANNAFLGEGVRPYKMGTPEKPRPSTSSG